MYLKLLFTGDFAPCRGFESMSISRGASIFGNLKGDITAADVAFVNLETPLCSGGKAIAKTGPNLRAHPDCVKPLAEAKFDVVGLANNHIMDFGPNGLTETMRICQDSGLSICGAGANLAEAQSPLLIEKKGVRLAFIAVAEHEFSIAKTNKPGAAPLDPIDNTAQIKAARKEADLVFMNIHGGNEHFEYPRPGLQKLCKFFIDRGADGVFCTHPHVPGAYEFYKDKPIVYSLGSLILDSDNPPKGWDEGYAVRLEYDTQTVKLISFELIPYTQSVHQNGVNKMGGKEKSNFLDKLEKYGQTLSNSVSYEKAWVQYCKSKETDVILKMFLPFHFRGLARICKYIPIVRLLLLKASIARRKSLIRCESHYELLLELLERR